MLALKWITRLAVLTSLTFVVASCGEEDDTSEVEDTSFDGSGQVASWGQYNDQNADLYTMLLTPDDFVEGDDTFFSSSSEQIQSIFDNSSNRSDYLNDSAGGIDILTASGIDRAQQGSRVGFDYSVVDYDTLTTCLYDLVKDVAVETSKNEFKFSIAIDATACYEDGLAEGYTEHTYTFTSTTYGQCHKKNLDHFNGLTLAELVELEDFESSVFCNQLTSYAHSSIATQAFDRSFTYTDANGDEQTSEGTYTYVTKLGSFDAAGLSCQRYRKDDNVLYENGCTDHSLVSTTTESGGNEYTSHVYTKKTTADLVKAVGDHDWFSTGSYEIEYNGWTGTVTFSDPDTPATWEVTDGTDTHTGEFAAVE